MFSFEKLDAWKVAVELRGVVMRGMRKGVSRSTQDQIERSTASILSNIGEGAGRFNPKEKRYFYDVGAP
jgi:four helix bundle protein